MSYFFFFFFFFQAEDGIRDLTVTGVQTCALPICAAPPGTGAGAGFPTGADPRLAVAALRRAGRGALPSHDARLGSGRAVRSEERRVGKECRSRWSPYH